MRDSGRAGLMHRLMLAKRDVEIAESTIARISTTIKRREFPAGTWFVGMRVYSTRLWKLIKEGTLTGFSIGGTSASDSAKRATSGGSDLTSILTLATAANCSLERLGHRLDKFDDRITLYRRQRGDLTIDDLLGNRRAMDGLHRVANQLDAATTRLDELSHKINNAKDRDE